MTASNIKNWNDEDWNIVDEITRQKGIVAGVIYMRGKTGLSIIECVDILSVRESSIERYRRQCESRSNIKNWGDEDWIIVDEIIRRGNSIDGIKYMRQKTGLGIADCKYYLSERESWIERYEKGLESRSEKD